MSEYESEVILDITDLTKLYGFEIKIGSKTFGHKTIGIENIFLQVKKGEIFSFLGPNGAGKTTTIRTILGYLKANNGAISIFGKDYLKEGNNIRKRIGYIPGELSLYDNFTGNELIDYFSNFRPVDNEFLEELKSIFKVKLNVKIKTLSKGNKQQVGLIAVLSSKPDFLILDEPSSGLDPLMTANFHKVLKKLQNEGITIFLSSHDLSEVQAISNRVGIIKEGRIILVEEISNLKTKFLQNISVKFKEDSNLPLFEDFTNLPSVVSCEEFNGLTFQLRIKEDINSILQFLTNYEIEKLTVSDASLEEIFLHYYV